jgi:hypothetical protein
VPAHTTRYQVLYARQNWRDMRVMLGIVFVLYLGLWGYDMYRTHFSRASITQGIFTTFMPLALLPFVRWFTRLNYVELGPDEVRVRLFFRRASIAYTDIERVRTETVAHLFERPDRARMRSAIVRRLSKEHALCLRVRDDQGQVALLRRRLGGRSVLDRDVALPIADVEAAFHEVKAHLSARRPGAPQAPAGPGRRPGRGRRRR